MDKKIVLPEKVNLILAIHELNLSHFSNSIALNTILSYSNSNWLNLYFDIEIEGLAQNTIFGEITTPDEGFVDFIPIESNWIEAFPLSTPKRVISAQASQGSNNTSSLSLHTWQVKDEVYKCVNLETSKYDFIHLSCEDIYIFKSELIKFKADIEGNSLAPPKNTISNDMKALALIARDLADKKTSFRIGNKVNASAFKNHVLELANKYKVSDNGLKTIDDRINKALDKFELNSVINPN